MTSLAESAREAVSQSTASAVQGVVRFLRVVQRRIHIVIATMVIAALLGAVYYGTATRIFEGKATLLVTQTGPDVWNASMAHEGGRQSGLMPTCERLISSAVVIDDAVSRIAQLPPELRTDFAGQAQADWGEKVTRNLSARALRQTNLIDVGYRSKSPQAARAVVDAVVSSYLTFMDKTHRDASVEIVSVLDNARKELEDKIQQKQKQLVEIKQRVRDLGLRDGSKVIHPTVQRVVTLNDALVEAQKQRVDIEVSLAAVRTAIERNADLQTYLMAAEPAVAQHVILRTLSISPEAAQDTSLLQRKLIEDRAQLEMLQTHYGKKHPKVAQLQAAILNAEEYIVSLQKTVDPLAAVPRERLASVLTGLLTERLVEAKARERQLRIEFQAVENEAVAMNDQMADLQIVEDELERVRGFHKSLLDKIATIDVSQNRADVQLSVVSEPAAIDQPVSPKLAFVVLLCVLAGSVSGLGAVYVLDQLDDRFRSPEELQQQLGVPLLAMVRRLDELPGSGAAALQVHVAPQAVESEAFRTLRTTLAFAGYSRIAVTSAEPGDGKTTVLANLAVALSQANKRTLLIDGDLRRPGLTQLFGLRGAEGLSQLLRSPSEVEVACRACIRPSGIDHLDVLPAGSRLTDPAELIGSPRMAQLVAWAEGVYDQVLIDCPPIMAASDAAVLGRHADGIMLIVQPAKNDRRMVTRAVDELLRLKMNVIGVVVNCVDEEIGADYYGYGSGNGYGYQDEEGDEQVLDAGTYKDAA